MQLTGCDTQRGQIALSELPKVCAARSWAIFSARSARFYLISLAPTQSTSLSGRKPPVATHPALRRRATGGSAAVAVSEMRAEKVSSRPEADIRFAIYILLSLNPENGESNLQGLPPDRLTKFLSDVRDKDLCKHLLQSELHVTIRLPVHA